MGIVLKHEKVDKKKYIAMEHITRVGHSAIDTAPLHKLT